MADLDFQLSCPIPLDRYPVVTLAHGGGGRLMNQLIAEMFTFGQDEHDSAVFSTTSERLAFTTDSFVVNPLFFPGGDIGRLAVCGTVNDLAMSGATPRYLSLALILEEGFPMLDLWKIIQSIQHEAQSCGVRILTGDTKVVERGHGHGLYINTSGIGELRRALTIGPKSIIPGDALILSGDLGRHGIAVMSVRDGIELDFGTPLLSDCAPLHRHVEALLNAGLELHCLRDLTRGGLASALNELAHSGSIGVEINESAIDVCPEVQGACELLGLDPLYVANEGRFALFLPEKHAEKALEILSGHGSQPKVIGAATTANPGSVILRTAFGTTRVVDLLSGEQLPRIC